VGEKTAVKLKPAPLKNHKGAAPRRAERIKMKAFLAGVGATIFVLLVIVILVLVHRKENTRKANFEYLKELAIKRREDFCSMHIGELKGARHEAALTWWHTQSFALEGREHRISEEDLNSCLGL
jgi:hypothetical protein